jgi:hypothetical protein
MMNRKTRAVLVVAALIMAQLACNFPGQTGAAPQLPGPNQTLTALFAVSPATSATPTLPPIVTATPPGGAILFTATPPSGAPPSLPTSTNTPAAAIVFTPTTAPTIAPTKTYTPMVVNTPTYAPVPATRPNGSVVAKYLNTPPTIDGDWSEWKDLTTEYPMNHVVWGAANWTGENDLSGSFHIGWDNNNLYIAVKIRDDRYVQNQKQAMMYQGDSIEVLLDTVLQGDYYYNVLSPDDYQLGLSPGNPDTNGTKEAYRWFPSNLAGSLSNVAIASRTESGLYRLEAAIPWSDFGMTPANGAHYGFALSANDNDDPNVNAQQSMISNVATRYLANPTTWGDIQFVK